MNFVTDEQTLNDLHLNQRRQKNIFSLYAYTVTTKGGDLLMDLLSKPLTNPQEIHERIDLFRFFCTQDIKFPIRGDLVDTIDFYLQEHATKTQLNSKESTLKRKLGLDWEYNKIRQGVLSSIHLLNAIKTFIEKNEQKAQGSIFEKNIRDMEQIISSNRLNWALEESAESFSDYEKIAVCDSLLRFKERELLYQLLGQLYWLDVCTAVARAVKERGLVFPKPLPKEENKIVIRKLFHPLVENAVPNDVEITQKHQVIFLTGANMAGKSTFMKAFGVSLYLAHTGFPVPAQEMEFSVRDGLYTTINLPDQIERGYSHFYAEVKRVKMIAQKSAHNPYLVILFDELFRGTNVKDAYDGTLAVTQAYAQNKQTIFLVSTHITEAGKALSKNHPNIRFLYLPTQLKDEQPVFTYKLQEGITNDRFGMRIVNNERIVELITGEEKVEAPANTKESGIFYVDDQTLKDLELFNTYNKDSIFNLYNKTVTGGGERYLRLLFTRPLSDEASIKYRSSLFEYFKKLHVHFPIDNNLMKVVQLYWKVPLSRFYFLSVIRLLWWRFAKSDKYRFVLEGVLATINVMSILQDYLSAFNDNDPTYEKQRSTFQEVLENKKLSWWRKEVGKKYFSYAKLAKYDYLLRYKSVNELTQLRRLLYELDACISVAETANEKGYVCATPRSDKENYLHIEGLYHLLLKAPVANSLHIDQQQNMFFLTGANMAGKSSFMKAVGITVYLAHAGFPVPARSMEFSTLEGMYTSINLSDNIDMGYSHFFAEVLRIKNVAKELNQGKRLMIIMDELFKGTNVKDAYDATLAITRAFANTRNSLFLISTHIIETASELQQHHQNILFRYFPARMEGDKPVYPYKLTDGITTDRYGMVIINHEKVIETIEAANREHLSAKKEEDSE